MGLLMRLAALVSFCSSGCESVMPASLVASRTLTMSFSERPVLLLLEFSEVMAEKLKIVKHQAAARSSETNNKITLLLENFIVSSDSLVLPTG